MNDEQLSQMQHMLAGCLSPDNAARKAAEEVIKNHLNEHREVFIYGLIKLIRTSQIRDVRVLSAIILRQTLPQGDTVMFVKLSEQLQAGIKTELLQAILHEPERYVRSQISDTVASLASVLLYRNQWPELLPSLFQMCEPAQPNEALKVCALDIMGSLADSADNLLPHIPTLHAAFTATLAPNNGLAVREAACGACCRIITILEVKEHTAEFRKFIVPFLQTLGDALTQGDEDAAKTILAGLTEVATEEGKFFEHDLDKIIPAMYAIGADTTGRGLDDGLRQYACEVLIGMAESLPPMIRKSPMFIKHSILVCMSLMLDVEEDPLWGQKEDSNDFYDNSNFDCGEMTLDRLALVVKGQKLWPVLKPILDQFVSDKTNWKMRHAGLFALAQTLGELAFEKIPVTDVCNILLTDPHPRVRYAAVQCLGQLPVDFEAITQTKHHKTMYPALMEALKDHAQPRVQMHAASALLNMVDGTDPKVLKRYLAPLMALLIGLLQNSKQMVQEQVMPVMAACASQAPVSFLPYYDQIVPLLKHIIAHASTPQTRRLRAKAMESVSFIGMYCGKEKFHNDAKEIMQMFLVIMQQAQATAGSTKQRRALAAQQAQVSGQAQPDVASSSDDDYSEQHMLQAWTRICTCLGEEFVPVLPYVMPQVWAIITRKSDHELAQRARKVVFNANGEEEPTDGSGGYDDEDEEDPNVDKDGRVKSISASEGVTASSRIDDRPTVLAYNSAAHTAAMEDKAMALSMLCSFCHDLREHFLPFVKGSAELMIPLLDHTHEEVQAHAIQGMPHLFRSAIEAHKKGMASLDFCKSLLEAMVTQMCAVFPRITDASTLQTMVVALHDCIDEAGPLARLVLDGAQLHSFTRALLSLLNQSHDRMEQREKRLKKWDEDGDLDEERIVEVETLNASEDGLNTIVASCVEAMIKSHQEAFIPVFDVLFVEVQRMLSVSSLPSTRKIAIFILDDVIQHLSDKGAAKYYPHVIEAMCIYACDMNEEHGLRQAAAFGIGLAAKHGGAAFTPFKAEIIKRFTAAIQADPTYLARAQDAEVGQEFIPTSEDDDGTGEDAEEEGEGDEGEPEEEEDETEDDYDERSRHCAIDNLVTALGHIAMFQNEPSLLPLWLSFLPLRQDEVESAGVYHTLLSLIEANNPLILGESMSNLPKLLSIFLVLVNTNMLKNVELRKRVKGFFANIKTMPPALLAEVAKHLVPSLQQKLQKLLAAI